MPRLPDELKKIESNKNLKPPEPPRDGWEIVDIIEQKPAEAEDVVTSSQVNLLLRLPLKL